MRFVEAAGLRVSAIGLGTWQFGTAEWGYGTEYAQVTAPALVRRALELGVTLIDTAEAYGDGASELIIGSAIGDVARDPIVATKMTPLWPTPSGIESHAERSRRRLAVLAIDLYQLHWPNPIVPLRLQAEGLRRIVDRGITRQVGVSNHSLGRWQGLERSLGRPVVSNQVDFSLARPGAARDLIPWASGHDRLVIAYSPLAQGRLTDTRPPRRNMARMLRRGFGARSWRALAPLRALLAEIATARHATPAQVALAWVISHPNVVAIPGARTMAQLEQNTAAADLALPPDDLARLTAAANS